jgi:hypothetical protein
MQACLVRAKLSMVRQRNALLLCRDLAARNGQPSIDRVASRALGLEPLSSDNPAC